MGHPAHHHKVNYVEFSSTDISKTKEFYGEVFGWTFQEWAPDYVSFSAENAGIDGGFRLLPSPQGSEECWSISGALFPRSGGNRGGYHCGRREHRSADL